MTRTVGRPGDLARLAKRLLVYVAGAETPEAKEVRQLAAEAGAELPQPAPEPAAEPEPWWWAR